MNKVRVIKNRREAQVAKQFSDLGWKYLKRGWPDFLFYNDKGEFFCVEVKKKQKRETLKGGLSLYQREMKRILGDTLKIRVEYIE